MEMCVNRDEGEAHVWVLDYWICFGDLSILGLLSTSSDRPLFVFLDAVVDVASLAPMSLSSDTKTSMMAFPSLIFLRP
ncbi:uncharacterized protein G2W53_026058 [Senna tora]|uniref:Uncharacterized protein n=1 Tax=Senna tora TaxID=362788 RepID=A0A834TEE6_9FABA|nr:uncharacterized protein G2W53_026058 [Senna tora]